MRNNPVLPDELKRDLQNPKLLTLDASLHVTDQDNLETLELHSREFILQIHRKRIASLHRKISQR